MEHAAYLRYIDLQDDDIKALRSFVSDVKPEIGRICEAFYDAAMREPVAREILRDAEQVKRLMQTLEVWIIELLEGPYDDRYVDRRLRIGEVHVRVGVPHSLMFAAMQVVREELLRVVEARVHSEDSRAVLTRAIDRVTQLDLMLMTRRYHEKSGELREVDSQRLLLENLPAMVLLCDRDERVSTCTPAFRTRFERCTGNEQSLAEVLPPPLYAAIGLPECLVEVFDEQRTLTIPHVEVVLGDEAQTFTITVRPLIQESQLAMMHVEDHTLAVRNEALLMRQRHLARLGSLSATIAHELRNPLAGIGGALQIIRRGMLPDDRYAPVMSKVLDQVYGLNGLVSDLLAFARPRDAEIVPDVDLGAIAQEQVDLVRSEHEQHRFQVDSEGSTHVSADPLMVRQILTNLILNSVQATPHGGQVWVHISAHGVRVEDDGPGVGEDARSHLFEPFHTTKLHGTGLGLANSQRMAELMHATLTLVDPKRLRGAAFLLQFDV